MASARAHASTSDPQQKQQPSNCGATSVGHASLVSFARSASARNMPAVQDAANTNQAVAMPVAQFGCPSNMGAAPVPPQILSAEGQDGDNNRVGSTTEFERASAAMRASRTPGNRNESGAESCDDTTSNVNRSPRVGSVPKRMREPMTVDTLTGMLHEMPCPSSSAPGDKAACAKESNVFGGDHLRISPSPDTQKRRRTAPSIGTTNTTDLPPPSININIDATASPDDDMTDDLCFLVDQVALKEDVEKEQKFMPYIV